jgi:hypothetical protein
MQRTLEEHIRFLEERILTLTARMGRTDRKAEERNRLQADISSRNRRSPITRRGMN